MSSFESTTTPVEQEDEPHDDVGRVEMGSSWMATYFNLTNTAIGAGTLVGFPI